MNSRRASFIGILLEDSGMCTLTEKRDEKRRSGHPFSPLNRHGVMHGIDCDYATESNGLRAASLIALPNEIFELKAPDNVA
jgi:hypothetical protein